MKRHRLPPSLQFPGPHASLLAPPLRNLGKGPSCHLQPETHILRWPESPYGEGMTPPLEPQPQPPSLPSLNSLLDEPLVAMGILDIQAPSPGASANAGVHPALLGTPSVLEEFSMDMGIQHTFGASTWASVVAAQQPAVSCTPSLLEEILAAKGISDMPGPSLGPSANERAPLALPGSPSLQDVLLASMCIPGSPGPSPGSSTAIAGEHQALPGSPNLLEEILAATAIQDIPWASPGATVEEEGVDAILETPLSEDEYQALLDMLPGSPGPGA